MSYSSSISTASSRRNNESAPRRLRSLSASTASRSSFRRHTRTRNASVSVTRPVSLHRLEHVPVVDEDGAPEAVCRVDVVEPRDVLLQQGHRQHVSSGAFGGRDDR